MCPSCSYFEADEHSYNYLHKSQVNFGPSQEFMEASITRVALDRLFLSIVIIIDVGPADPTNI